MTDRATLDVYDREAARYDALPRDAGEAADRDAFLHALPFGAGPVLDWGCGPGHHAAAMVAVGVPCEATDASPEMVARALERGVAARHEPFEGLPAIPVYRGIWANFSLLHAERDALPVLIRRAASALLPGGVLHVAMKRGAGMRRDGLGRRYSYVEAADLAAMTRAAGLRRIAERAGEGRGLDGASAPYVVHLSRRDR